ncbi:bifunctional enoyl-CoA hydratase/phosphate acetyltransferase [Pseudorhodoplanes sinuspersici]|nr:bifunctional enoyl-CoA hydratase/phosphate acetyltransferase [Pseudorhodoplanes sinuspersici]RKE69049.1 phosphate acetyltransferase [Pseudorhodoplanes sinuspersici]
MAVVAANSTVVLESVREASTRGLIEPILIGCSPLIARLAEEMEWHLDGIRIVPAASEEEAAHIGVSMIRSGAARLLMKGHLHTDILMRAVLHRYDGLRTNRRISHVFHMSVPYSQRELMITDAAVNVAPDLQTKLDIVLNASDLARALGHERPRVALLSATEQPSNGIPSSIEAAAVMKLLIKNGCHFDVYGPLAFDNAVSPAAARLKGIDHPVAGNADILVVPNIETGNALFKMMVHFMGATAGGVVLGAAAPIVLTSRADPAEARLAATALARRMIAVAATT